MNELEQRLAIAEACGWKPEVRRAEIPEADFVHEETFWTKDGETSRGPWLPDYLNDLNAMHEAETVLFNPSRPLQDRRRIYFNELKSHIPGHTLSGIEGFMLIHLTAAKRAEAFLKTIGKWRDHLPANASSCDSQPPAPS